MPRAQSSWHEIVKSEFAISTNIRCIYVKRMLGGISRTILLEIESTTNSREIGLKR